LPRTLTYSGFDGSLPSWLASSSADIRSVIAVRAARCPGVRCAAGGAALACARARARCPAVACATKWTD
jgi:hypothetical protein